MLRWKKLRVGPFDVPMCVLRKDGEEIAFAQQIRKGDNWFWYGMGYNTAHRPDTLENVKAEAIRIAKERSE
jgi:hypothetical protein